MSKLSVGINGVVFGDELQLRCLCECSNNLFRSSTFSFVLLVALLYTLA